MGVIKRGILGGFSGRVANVVGSSWKGIAYMKSIPLSVANPQTTGQTTQRNAFRKTVEIAGILLADCVKPLWDRFAQGMSGYNSFVQANVANFPNGVFTPSNLQFSRGSLYAGQVVAMDADASANTVTFELSDALGSNGLSTDEGYLAVWNITQEYWVQKPALFTRADDAYFYTDTEMGTGDELWAYIAYRRADGTMVSNHISGSCTVVA